MTRYQLYMICDAGGRDCRDQSIFRDLFVGAGFLTGPEPVVARFALMHFISQRSTQEDYLPSTALFVKLDGSLESTNSLFDRNMHLRTGCGQVSSLGFPTVCPGAAAPLDSVPSALSLLHRAHTCWPGQALMCWGYISHARIAAPAES